MGFDKIKELKETYDVEVANSYLAKGFGLKILSTRRSTNDSDEVRPIYILGLKA